MGLDGFEFFGLCHWSEKRWVLVFKSKNFSSTYALTLKFEKLSTLKS